MGRTSYSVTLWIEVNDAEQVRADAAARAIRDGLSAADWEATRTGTEDDLRMLLDPGGSPSSGFEIQDSSAERH